MNSVAGTIVRCRKPTAPAPGVDQSQPHLHVACCQARKPGETTVDLGHVRLPRVVRFLLFSAYLSLLSPSVSKRPDRTITTVPVT